MFRLLFRFFDAFDKRAEEEKKNIYCYDDRENIFSFIFMIFFSFRLLFRWFFLACSNVVLMQQHSQAGKIIHHILAHSQTLHQTNFSSSVCWMKTSSVEIRDEANRKLKILHVFRFLAFVSFFSFFSSKLNLLLSKRLTICTNDRRKKMSFTTQHRKWSLREATREEGTSMNVELVLVEIYHRSGWVVFKINVFKILVHRRSSTIDWTTIFSLNFSILLWIPSWLNYHSLIRMSSLLNATTRSADNAMGINDKHLGTNRAQVYNFPQARSFDWTSMMFD